MDEDEILRLCQITGLESLFKDEDFSKSWNIEDSALNVTDYEPLTDDVVPDDARDGRTQCRMTKTRQLDLPRHHTPNRR